MSRSRSTPSRRPDPRGSLWRGVIAFAVVVVLVYLLGAVIGWERTLVHLRRADLGWVLVACLSTILCLGAWAKTWQVVLSAIGVSVGYRRLVVTFFAGAFANYVTPMGQAGGEPFVAYVLSRETPASYEQSLASVVTADLLRLVPFFNVAAVGLGYLLARSQLGESVERFALLLVVLAVGLPVLLVALWRVRERAKRAALRAIAPVARRTERFDVEGAENRIDRLYDSIEVIAASRRALLVAVGFSYVGWILFALPLYFAGLALGLSVPLLLVCFLVPVTVVAGSTPSPGGLAVIEGTLVTLLSALVAMNAAEALAVTTLYRLASYWLVVVLGGAAALVVLARS